MSGWCYDFARGVNAPRTVGTLGRGELSPPIMITARAQKKGEGEESLLKKNIIKK